MQTLVKIPSRSRPTLFLETLRLYLADETAQVLVTLDRDDLALPKYLDGLKGLDRVKVRVGQSKTKVEAINDGVAEEDWSLLVLASDDMIPQRPDYAVHIRHLFEAAFPQGDGVLHVNDGHNQRVLNSIPILDRKYFDRFGWIYNPCYRSVFCDEEMQAISERLGRSHYVDEIIIRHDWIGSTAPDDLHRRNESAWDEDKATFERRKAAGFPAE